MRCIKHEKSPLLQKIIFSSNKLLRSYFSKIFKSFGESLLTGERIRELVKATAFGGLARRVTTPAPRFFDISRGGDLYEIQNRAAPAAGFWA